MALTDNKTIFVRVTEEIVGRIIGLTFIDLRGDVPTPTLARIRQAVIDASWARVTMTEGSTFSGIIRSLAVQTDGSIESIDKALELNDHVRYQIKEIASVLAPIVIQSIRALDQFQTEADEILFSMQQQITNQLTQDHTQANFEIVPVELGVFDDAEALNTSTAIAEQYIPNADRNYVAFEYRKFADRVPFHTLSVQEKGELNKFLMEHDLYNETLRHALSMGISPEILFPDDLTDPKVHADHLTTLWEYAMQLQNAIQTLPEDSVLDANIISNIKGLVVRLALAIHWGRYVVDHNNKNSLIAGHDTNTIYVYPRTYNTLDNQAENKDETIKNFVRSKLIQEKASPAGGYTVNDVINSRKTVGNVLSDYRRKVIFDQKEHTKRVIKTVVQETLKDYPAEWILKITKDLIDNSEATLSDILTALITRCGDYYLAALYGATETQEFSAENPNEARANVVLSFLVKVARDRIVAPQV